MEFPLFKIWRGKRGGRIHLDYASTTPVRPEVLRAMLPYFSEHWANPSAIYTEGVFARDAVDAARTRLARTLEVRATDIVFTSGGTESNNLALVGTIEALHRSGRSYADMEVVSTRIEHPSVIETLAALMEQGVHVRYADVHEDGRIDVLSFESLLSDKTVLVTVAYVNSEIGTVERVKRLSRIINKKYPEGSRPLLHVDASQAPLWLPCSPTQLGADLMTLDAGKCYGPKGMGVLVVRHGTTISPQLRGGGQERGLRSGTENVPLIVGGVEAFVLAQEGWKSRSVAVAMLRDRFFDELARELPEAVVNGSRTERVANNVNVSLPHFDTEYAVVVLDHEGIAASTRSACGGSDRKGSHVVRVCTGDEQRALSTIRFTLGEDMTNAQILEAVRALKAHVAGIRAFQKKVPPGGV